MKIEDSFGLYLVLTNPLKGYSYMTSLAVDYQIPFVQLRIKESDEITVAHEAEKMVSITKGTKTRFIINDYPQLVSKIGADGVHIGQDDLSYEKTRELVGPEAIIGLSTHSPQQTQKACALGPDYIGVGPVFPTPTKKNPDPVIGLDGMKKMIDCATVPAVAIGGIDLSNIHQVLANGARNFCMVRQITQSEHPEKILKEVLKIVHDYHC